MLGAEILTTGTLGSVTGLGMLVVSLGFVNGMGVVIDEELPGGNVAIIWDVRGDVITAPIDVITDVELPVGVDTGVGIVTGIEVIPDVGFIVGIVTGIEVIPDVGFIVGIVTGIEVIPEVGFIVGIVTGIGVIIGIDVIPDGLANAIGMLIGGPETGPPEFTMPADINARPSSDSTVMDAVLLDRTAPSSRRFLG